MFNVYLSIGGNLGDRVKNLTTCLLLLEENIGKVVAKSSIYETKAWGNKDQPDFLNMVVKVTTTLQPQQLLQKTQEIELLLGRKRLEHWGSRTIDIDILLFDNEIIDSHDLKVPHPYIQERKFVLVPLAEIANFIVHPILKKTVEELLNSCTDNLEVLKLKAN